MVILLLARYIMGGGVAFYLYNDWMEGVYDVCYSNLSIAFSHGCVDKMCEHGANRGNIIELLSNLYDVTPEFINNLMKYKEVFFDENK